MSVSGNNQVIFIREKCTPEGADSHTVAEGVLLVNFSPQWVLFCYFLAVFDTLSFVVCEITFSLKICSPLFKIDWP